MLLGTDIVFVHSGGPGNFNPNQDLGGTPSSYPILPGINNLFSDAVVSTGSDTVDYRCFYVFNNSATDAFKSVSIWIDSEVAGGSNIQLGLNPTNEVQLVTVTGTVTPGGTITMQYDNLYDFTFAQDADTNQWALNFQNSIRVLTSLESVLVIGTTFPNNTQFSVTFAGEAGNRGQVLLQLVSHTLGGGVLVSAKRQTAGGPINVIPGTIANPFTLPTGVVFNYPTQANPLQIGDLRPLEGFPVWIQRDTPAGVSTLADDGTILRISGTVLP